MTLSDDVQQAFIYCLFLWTCNLAAFFFGYFTKRFWAKHVFLHMDFGIKFFDGKPLLGNNKTYLAFPVILMTGLMLGGLFSHSNIGILCGMSVVLGSVILSFVKRRLKIPEGGSLPIFDQLDYVAGLFLLHLILGYKIHFLFFLTIVFLSLPVHTIANLLAFKYGLKEVWW